MVHRQTSVSSPDVLEDDLHNLNTGNDFSSPDCHKWQVQGNQTDIFGDQSVLATESNGAIFGHGYQYDSSHHLPFQSHSTTMYYPHFFEPPYANVETREQDMFNENSTYMRKNSIRRMTPQSQASVSVSGTRAGSGRSTTKSSSPGTFPPRSSARVSKPRPRKSHRTSKAVVGKYKKLEVPLSQWAMEKGAEPKDVLAYIERPLEQRRKEARDKKDGKPGRPMNQFMLYRSAFIPVAQRYCEDGEGKNHQVVSRLCGESWQSEPDDFKKIYEGLAKKEREQHAKAFPDYKFTPKNKDRGEEGEEEDLINDGEWNPRSRPGQAIRGSARFDSTYVPNTYSVPVPGQEGQYDFDNGFEAGSYGLNPARPLFSPHGMMHPGDALGQHYHQPGGSDFLGMQGPEDLQLTSVPGQDLGGQFLQGPQLSGFDAWSQHPLGARDLGHGLQQGTEQHLDPFLELQGGQSGGTRGVEPTSLYDD